MQIWAIYLAPPTGKKGDGSSVDTSCQRLFSCMHKELKNLSKKKIFFSFSRRLRRPGNQTNRKELLTSGTVSASYSDMSKHINQTSKKACKKRKEKKKLSNVRISILFTDFKLSAPICLHLLRLGSSICRIHKKRT